MWHIGAMTACVNWKVGIILLTFNSIYRYWLNQWHSFENITHMLYSRNVFEMTKLYDLITYWLNLLNEGINGKSALSFANSLCLAMVYYGTGIAILAQDSCLLISVQQIAILTDSAKSRGIWYIAFLEFKKNKQI